MTFPGNILFLALAGLLAGCDGKERKSESAGSAIPADECFLFVQARDSIKLRMTNNAGRISGRLGYLFYEKDKSRGTIEGVQNGDTVFVTYSFTAEGTYSHRELALLRRGDSLLMGSGEIINTGNRDVFKDRNAVVFTGEVVLNRINCAALHWRLP